MDGEQVFVSHAGSDRAWAEWVAWQLAEAGYAVELDMWDWANGQNFMAAMSDALDRADRVVALISVAYLDRSRYTMDELWASLLHPPATKGKPATEAARLVPILVEEIPPDQMPSLLRPRIYCDLHGKDSGEAKRLLRDALQGPRQPDHGPKFPGPAAQAALSRLGGSGPRLPGTVPRVWNIPPRNPSFTGRDQLINQMREALTSGGQAVAHALHGLGGIGKTQAAAEYAWRFAGAYEFGWWIDSEQAGLIGNQFAVLGAALRCVEPGAPAEAVRDAVLGELRERGRWLLVFDNAKAPEDIAGWLPGGGHVLISSRKSRWNDIAVPVEVDILSRHESVALLSRRMSGLGEEDTGRLAEALGDLPLALVQAAEYLATTGTGTTEYLRELETKASAVLGEGRPALYPRSMAAATLLAADELASGDPVAAELAGLCAFLAPEAVPLDLFTIAAKALPAALAERAASPPAWRQTAAMVVSYGLARLDQRGLLMHRVTQAILRDRLTGEQAAAIRRQCEAILAASQPGDTSDPGNWARWGRLMPHVLAADLAGTASLELRLLACRVSAYLLARGETQSSHDLTVRLHPQWQRRLGADERSVLGMTHQLAWTLKDMGRYQRAHDLEQDVFARARRVLGDKHPDTLTYAVSLAVDLSLLGEVKAARDLGRETLERLCEVLGADHPRTLASASNLAVDLSVLGDVAAAFELDRETLDRRREVLGADHPETLASAGNLAVDLRYLGELIEARELDRETLDRRRRVLGTDHPHTLISASNLAADERVLDDAS